MLKIVSSTNEIKLKNRFKIFSNVSTHIGSSSVKNKYNNKLTTKMIKLN